MARVKGAMMTRKRRNKVMKMAKGYWGSRSKHFHDRFIGDMEVLGAPAPSTSMSPMKRS